MRTLVLFIFVICSVFLAGSLLSYPVFLVLSPLTDLSFDKVIHFSVLLIGIGLGLYYLKHSRQFIILGLNITRRMIIRHLITGFISGLVLLFIVESSLFILGMRQIDPDLNVGLTNLAYAGTSALVTGIVVGISEEILFRGAIFTGLARYSGNFYALIVSSLFYAGVHFYDVPPVNVNSEINWYSGVTALLNSYDKLFDPGIWDSFLSLFVLGVLLSMVRWNTSNIIQCTGLHAGIVTINKIFSYGTNYREGSIYVHLVNTYDHLTGHLASFWLVLACVLYYHLYMRNKTSRKPAFEEK